MSPLRIGTQHNGGHPERVRLGGRVERSAFLARPVKLPHMSDTSFAPEMESIAREAGALLLSYFGKISIEYKGDADLVTEADRAAERLITERIVALWPDHDLMGEEGARRERGSDYKCDADPL